MGEGAEKGKWSELQAGSGGATLFPFFFFFSSPLLPSFSFHTTLVRGGRALHPFLFFFLFSSLRKNNGLKVIEVHHTALGIFSPSPPPFSPFFFPMSNLFPSAGRGEEGGQSVFPSSSSFEAGGRTGASEIPPSSANALGLVPGGLFRLSFSPSFFPFFPPLLSSRYAGKKFESEKAILGPPPSSLLFLFPLSRLASARVGQIEVWKKFGIFDRCRRVLSSSFETFPHSPGVVTSRTKTRPISRTISLLFFPSFPSPF